MTKKNDGKVDFHRLEKNTSKCSYSKKAASFSSGKILFQKKNRQFPG